MGGRMEELSQSVSDELPTSHIADSESVEYLLCVRIPCSFCTHHYGFDWTFPQCVWMGLIFGLALCWQTLGTLSDAPESIGDLQAAHLWGQIPQNEQLLHRTFILGTAQAMTQIPLLSHILHLSIVITSCLYPPWRQDGLLNSCICPWCLIQ